VDERGAKDGAAGRIANVARERERETESRRWTVDRSNDGLRRGSKPEQKPRHVLLIGEMVARRIGAVVSGRLSVSPEIEAGAEPAALARQHDHAVGAVRGGALQLEVQRPAQLDRKSTRLNSSHDQISY